MELFDTTGTEYYRNILWIIGLAIFGIFITYNYYDAVEREKHESTYSETTGVVNHAEQWKRTRKRNGRVESTDFFYKFNYQYFVDGKRFSGSAQRDEAPSNTIPVYYDSNNPATHVLKRKSSENEFGMLIIGGIAILVFIGVNVCLYKSKKKKVGDFG